MPKRTDDGTAERIRGLRELADREDRAARALGFGSDKAARLRREADSLAGGVRPDGGFDLPPERLPDYGPPPTIDELEAIASRVEGSGDNRTPGTSRR